MWNESGLGVPADDAAGGGRGGRRGRGGRGARGAAAAVTIFVEDEFRVPEEEAKAQAEVGRRRR